MQTRGLNQMAQNREGQEHRLGESRNEYGEKASDNSDKQEPEERELLGKFPDHVWTQHVRGYSQLGRREAERHQPGVRKNVAERRCALKQPQEPLHDVTIDDERNQCHGDGGTEQVETHRGQSDRQLPSSATQKQQEAGGTQDEDDRLKNAGGVLVPNRLDEPHEQTQKNHQNADDNNQDEVIL